MNDILLLLKEGQVPGHRLHVIIFAVSRRLGLGRGKEVNVKNMEGKYNTRSDQSEEPGERLCSTPISPGLLYPGDSMITLNKFNEDDDDGFFLGGFNEDGSFIGDYMDQDPETNRAVMNRLVGFQQLFSKKC